MGEVEAEGIGAAAGRRLATLPAEERAGILRHPRAIAGAPLVGLHRRHGRLRLRRRGVALPQHRRRCGGMREGGAGQDTRRRRDVGVLQVVQQVRDVHVIGMIVECRRLDVCRGLGGRVEGVDESGVEGLASLRRGRFRGRCTDGHRARRPGGLIGPDLACMHFPVADPLVRRLADHFGDLGSVVGGRVLRVIRQLRLIVRALRRAPAPARRACKATSQRWHISRK